MKYYSEKVKKLFDSEDELNEAEAKLEEKNKQALIVKEERAKAAKEVEDAYKAANDAYKVAKDKLNDFCKKYGSYHTTITDTNSLIDYLFDSWLF